MLPDREETGKDAQCCFCDLSITRCFLTLPGDGQCSTPDLRSEKSLIFKCGFSFSGGISLASLTSPISLPRWDLWHQLGSGAKPWLCSWGKNSWMILMAVECPGGPAQPCARGAGWGQRHCKSSAEPRLQEILISRNKSLFHLMGQSFPVV